MPSVRSSRAPNSPPSSDAEFVRPVRLALRLNPDTTRHCTAFATEATVAVAIHLYGWIGGLDNRTLTQGCGTMRAGGRRGRSWRDPAAVTAALDALGISSANIAEHRSMRRQAVHVVARHCRLPRTDRRRRGTRRIPPRNAIDDPAILVREVTRLGPARSGIVGKRRKTRGSRLLLFRRRRGLLFGGRRGRRILGIGGRRRRTGQDRDRACDHQSSQQGSPALSRNDHRLPPRQLMQVCTDGTEITAFRRN